MLNTRLKKCVVSVSGILMVAASPAVLAVTCDKDSGDITIAVASNFYEPAKDIATYFQGKGVTAKICHDSTGVLKSEIIAGNAGKYDVFLAADNKAPADLKAKNPTLVIGDVFSYAHGEPVLWSTSVNVDQGLPSDTSIKLIIAEPEAAPYGLAAQQILTNNGKWPYPNIEEKSNISLTYEAIRDGTNVMGFVAKSQVCLNGQIGGYHYEYPETDYDEIIQDGIVLNREGRTDAQTTAAKNFAASLTSDPAVRDNIIVSKYCYTLP